MRPDEHCITTPDGGCKGGTMAGKPPCMHDDGRFRGIVNAYRFCQSCGVRTDYSNPTCLYPYRHNGNFQG